MASSSVTGSRNGGHRLHRYSGRTFNPCKRRYMILKFILGIVIGGVLGFTYYKFVGCSTGTCPLTSHPVITTLYGAALGALIAGSFR